MTNEIYITVIIPTYKPKEYLWDCLNSFMNQTFSKDKFEVVLVLNGCKEPYNSDILSYINTHSYVNINYIQTDVGGVSYARNIGIDKAKGTYITFVDDDDLVSECYLSELFQISSQDTIGLAYPYAFNDGHLHTQLSYSLTKEYEKCSKIGKQSFTTPRKYFSGPCMKLFHKSIIGSRRFDVRFANGEDSLFMFLLSDRMKYVDFTSRKAVYYRRYRDNSAYTRYMALHKELGNCWRMFKVYTYYFFSNFGNYKLKKYLFAVLGLLHTVFNAFMKIKK